MKNKSDFAKFLEWAASQVDELVVGNQQAKDVFVTHIDKVMAEAEKYRKYLQAEYRKAKKAKRTLHADQPKGDEWKWYAAYGKGTTYYFDGEGTERWATFWMQGKPKLDPLDYLKSMVRGCVGEMCKTLEITDYQFTLLAVIYDAQRWAAGHERIYFYLKDNKTLADSFSDHLCSSRLSDEAITYIPIETLRAVQVTIKTALEKVKACISVETEQHVKAALTARVLKDEAKAKKLQKPDDFRDGHAIRLNFTIWNKDSNYKLLLAVINDSERKGVSRTNRRKLNTLKERLKKASKDYKDENYKKFADSLKYKEGRIYTEMFQGMIIPETKSKK